METKIKLATDYPHLFNNYDLTEIMTVKSFKKIKGLGLHIVLAEFLRDYGVYMGGKTWLCGGENNEQYSDEEVLAISIKIGEFPLDNELILRQLYGWNNRKVHIMLSGENTYGDFLYDLSDYSCLFQDVRFNTFAEMWEKLKETPTEYTTTEYTLSV